MARLTAKNEFPLPQFSFQRRLKEISMFFNRSDPVHQAMNRLVKRLKRAGIPYAIMGAMAVNAHGARRTTDDVDILLTQTGLADFRNVLGRYYEATPGRPRRFKEKKTGVTIDVLVTGGFPGSGQPGPISFPDPETTAIEIDRIAVLPLPELIQLKLAARRYYDFGDVVLLIRTHYLDETFAEKLAPSVRRDFVECLEEKRREDDYDRRQLDDV